MKDDIISHQREVTAAQLSRLEDWANRKPCIALMGEFSAGKTTLINFLLGEDILPTRVTATQLPPVWMSYGDPAAFYVDTDGQRHDLPFDSIDTVPLENARYIRLYCRGNVLETVDLIDTPGISDPNIPRQIWEVAVGYVNTIVWCTHATQAWRETERSAWESLPDRLRAQSVLLATRSDKLTETERARVLSRLEREAGEQFRNIIMFSATDAIKASAAEEASDLWQSSGADDLLVTLGEIAAEISEHRKQMLARYEAVAEPGAAASAEPEEPVRVMPSRVRPAGQLRDGDGSRARPSADSADAERLRVLETAEDIAEDIAEETDAAEAPAPFVLTGALPRDTDIEAPESDHETTDDDRIREAMVDLHAFDTEEPTAEDDSLEASEEADSDAEAEAEAEVEVEVEAEEEATADEGETAYEDDAEPVDEEVGEMSLDDIFATDIGDDEEASVEEIVADDNMTDAIAEAAEETGETYEEEEEDAFDASAFDRIIAAAAPDRAEPTEPVVLADRSAPQGGKPGSAVALWREVVARAPQVETVPDVLALIENFLAAQDELYAEEDEAAEEDATQLLSRRA